MRGFAIAALGFACACTAVYDDFDQCEVRPPEVFDSPVCGMAYLGCARGCVDNDCVVACSRATPGCEECINDTYRICSEEMRGCDTERTDLICCFEGLCGVDDPECEPCAGELAEYTACLEAVGNACESRIIDTCLDATLP